MGPLSTVVYPDVLRIISATTFTGAYQPVGGPLAQSARIVKFQNNTTSTVVISWDGVNGHDFLPAGSFLLIDVSSNKENAISFEIQQGTQFYVLGTVGTGNFYISNYFGK
jgi:hypothetical protein